MQHYQKSTAILFISLILLCSLPILWVSKGDLVLFLNDHHTPFLDSVFKASSTLGNGLIFIPVLLFMLFRKFKDAAITVGVFVLQAILCVLFKQVVYQNALRPKAFFGEAVQLTPVEGITHYSLNTFPSGHTATAFAAALLITLFINDHRWRIAMLIFAVMVAVSRIYLAQHFYVDTIAGALVGTFSAGSVWILGAEIAWPAWTNKRLHIHQSLSETV